MLGDGKHESHASASADDLLGGNRVFIAPICGTCNGSRQVLIADHDVQVLQLYAFFASEEADLQEFTAEFFNAQDAEAREDEYKQRCAEMRKEHNDWIAMKQREGLGDYDRALLVNSPISLGGRLSIPTFRRF